MFDERKIPILKQIPVTLGKLIIARLIYRILRVFLHKDRYIIRRGGICYEVDLSEGIDLALFIMGSFQGYIVRNSLFTLSDSAVVLDVGANIGSMTLRFAQLAKQGHVYAFEPTDFAFEKLLRNISLNPELSRRITPVQSFLSDHSAASCQVRVYASWKIDGTVAAKHPLHGGIIQPAEGVSTVTIDDFCEKKGIHRVDLIKIDTDGHELEVIKGAHKTIEKYRPCVIFEAGLYIMKEHGVPFELFFAYFAHRRYTLINCKNGKIITLENYYKEIPSRYTIDIVALPSEHSWQLA
jgi:FkbM family methyltransferase